VRRLAARLNRGLENLVIALFGILCLVVFGEVVSRYLLNQPHVGSEELIIYLFTWISFLGAALALRSGRHVSISYFVSLLPERAQHAIALAGDLVVLAFLGLLAVLAIRFARMNHTVNSITLQIPLSYIAASLVAMALLMIAAMLGRLREGVRRLRGGSGPTGEPGLFTNHP
jgi:TRAP-type C4-dicarboxylate transport system permease small subunit